jgi:hypothetical protein
MEPKTPKPKRESLAFPVLTTPLFSPFIYHPAEQKSSHCNAAEDVCVPGQPGDKSARELEQNITVTS